MRIRMRSFASDLTPVFKKYLCVRLAGTASQQMLLVALGWQMYDLTASAWDLGLVGLAQFLPALILTIPAGQIVDRVDRKRVLAASLVLHGIVALVLAVGSAGDWVTRGHILTLSVAIGVARALQAPSQQAMLPSLVPLDQLPRAAALSSSSMQLAVIGGPALGGFLYAFGATTVYAIGFAFIVVALTLLSTFPAFMPNPQSPVSVASVFEGFRFIHRNPVLLGAISLDLFAVLLGGATALLPIFAKDVLATGPWGLGLLRSAPAIGALAMALALARHPPRRRVGRLMFVSVAIYGVAMLGFAASTSLLLSMFALAVSGAADTVSVVIRQTLAQLETPDDLRGRVSAVNATFIGASNQLGEFRAGATAAVLGPVSAVIAGAVGTLVVVGLWMRMFPSLVARDRLQPSS
ncbi:MAG TPA: MFS transporter [Casimicrobiaceae bacterium]|nr:MFS transporter [Casimicrobiaceae bacterium]